MNKTAYWVIGILIVLIIIFGYLGRHRIKTMLAGSSVTPPQSTQTATYPTQTPMGTASASASVNNDIVTTKSDPSKGAYLADTKGMTLYTYDKDTNNISNCYGGCIKAWPIYSAPKTATSLPTDFSIVKRTDGTQMYAYKGHPLYHYISDTKVGDVTGDGVGGVWHLAKP